MADTSAEISQTLDADKPQDEPMDASIPTSKRPRGEEEGSDANEDDEEKNKKSKVEEMQVEEQEESEEETDGEGEEEEEGGGGREGEEEEEEGEEEEEDEGGEEEEEEEAEEVAEEGKEPVSVNLGPKTFNSSAKMYDYFNKLLHYWPTNINVNKVCLILFFSAIYL